MLVICGAMMLFAGRLYLAEQRKESLRKAKAPAADVRNVRKMDSLISLLHTGDVVLRMGTGTFSRTFAEFNRRDKSYSHCGIVMEENGKLFIYHCTGGGSDTSRCIKRETAAHFFSPVYSTAAAIARYPFEDTTITALKKAIQDRIGQRPAFDTYFDLATDDRLYCTEFVYKVIIQATADSAYLPVSHIPAGVFIGTDDLFLNTHARLIGQVRYY